MPDKIERFDGEYRFLSNFYSCIVEYRDVRFQNAEAAFQAAKCTDPHEIALFASMSPGQAKSAGRRVKLRPDWEVVKDGVMLDVVRAKFAKNPHLARMLLDTGDAELVEGNHWKDFYWGVCGGRGQNKLGQILMQVRRELRTGEGPAWMHGDPDGPEEP